jgi:hypothetical protein
MQQGAPEKGSKLDEASQKDQIDQRTAMAQSSPQGGGGSGSSPNSVAPKGKDLDNIPHDQAGLVEPADAKQRFAELFGFGSMGA